MQIRQSKNKTVLTLILALGIVLSFASCSMMFGQMLQSKTTLVAMPMDSMMHHGESASHHGPATSECCDENEMALMQVDKALTQQKSLIPVLGLFLILSSFFYLKAVSQKSNFTGIKKSPPKTDQSLFGLKTSFIQ